MVSYLTENSFCTDPTSQEQEGSVEDQENTDFFHENQLGLYPDGVYPDRLEVFPPESEIKRVDKWFHSLLYSNAPGKYVLYDFISRLT